MTGFISKRWKRLCEAAGLPGSAEGRFRELASRYSQAHRHYHNIRHIDECLQEFEDVRSGVKDPTALELALWLHDAVYDPRATDNEERSAALAIDWLAGTKESLIQTVSDLILTTKKHLPGHIHDAATLIDIDLSILGKSAQRFAEYEDAIRKEYDWVAPTIYREKRCDVLRRFLGRDRIYTTEFFFEKYEAVARRNLEKSIQLLSRE